MTKRKFYLRMLCLLACSYVLVASIMLGKNRTHAGDIPPYKFKTSATAVPVTTTLLSSHFLHIADIKICGGYGQQGNSATIDWGDGGQEFGSLGSPAGQPQYLNFLVGQHKFSKTGVFQIKFNLTVTCVNNNYPNWSDSVSGSSTAYVFNQPPDIASVTAPAKLAIGQVAVCTATLSAPAGLGGSQVSLISDSPSIQLLTNSIHVVGGQKTGTFKVRGVSNGVAHVYATSGEGTPEASTQIN